VDQSHEGLLPEKTVFDIISEGNDLLTVGNTILNSRAYISSFNFSGADQQKKLGVLSGGERNRVHLAITLKEGGNVLLLDEPTNDIDINTLRTLEDALENFAGCILVISHDRWFIDRLATHILSFEDEAEVVFFEGNYSDYEGRAAQGNTRPHLENNAVRRGYNVHLPDKAFAAYADGLVPAPSPKTPVAASWFFRLRGFFPESSASKDAR
jgi:sulfate-transporting ATPase